MNDCSDCFWSMKLPVFSNTPLHVFFWMRMVFAEGPWGRTVSAVVWSPLDEKEKCVNRERCFTMPLGLCKSLQAGCSHREPTPLCFQAHGQTLATCPWAQNMGSCHSAWASSVGWPWLGATHPPKPLHHPPAGQGRGNMAKIHELRSHQIPSQAKPTHIGDIELIHYWKIHSRTMRSKFWKSHPV